MEFESNQELIKKGSLYDQKSMHMPICFLIEDTRYMSKYIIDILDCLNESLVRIAEDKDLSHSADICITKFDQETEVLRDFSLITEKDETDGFLDFQCENLEAPDLGKGILDVITSINCLKGDYNVHRWNYYQPCIIVMGSGKAQKNQNLEKCISVVEELVSSKKLSIAPILVGHGDAEVYKKISGIGTYYQGEITEDLKDIFVAVTQSMNFLSSSSANAYSSLIGKAENWEKFKGDK